MVNTCTSSLLFVATVVFVAFALLEVVDAAPTHTKAFDGLNTQALDSLFKLEDVLGKEMARRQISQLKKLRSKITYSKRLARIGGNIVMGKRR